MSPTSDAASSRSKQLASLIERELKTPRSYGDVLEELAEICAEERDVMRFLRAKDDHHRHGFYVKSEEVWYRRFSWRIIRPLFLVALLAAIAYSFQRIVDPALGLASFVLGAVCVYLGIQYFAHRWMHQNQTRMKEVEDRYAADLESLLEELRARE
jgi:hypothetical protein